MNETTVTVTVSIGDITKSLSVDIENNSAKLLKDSFRTNMFTESIPTLARELKHSLETDEEVVNLIDNLSVTDGDVKELDEQGIDDLVKTVMQSHPTDVREFVSMVNTIAGYDVPLDILMPKINHALINWN